MMNKTNVPAKIPKPVPPKTERTAGTITDNPIKPYTTEGILRVIQLLVVRFFVLA